MKLERQKRIAARSSGPAQSPSTQQKKTQNLSPSIHRGSKFSDSPGSPSPLQRLPVRASAVGSTSRSDPRKQVVGNGVSRSVSSLSDAKKATPGVSRSVSSLSDTKKDAAPKIKAAPLQSKRISDSKGSDALHSSPKLGDDRITSKKDSSDPKVGDGIRASSLKSVRGDQARTKSSSDEPQPESNMANLDDSKCATTFPDVRLSARGDLSNTTKAKTAVGDPEQKGNERKHLATSGEVATKEGGEKTQQLGNGDDNGIVEKIVVMLEHESAPIRVPSMQKLEHEMETGNGSAGPEKAGGNETISGYAAIRAPPSPIVKCVEVNNGVTDSLLDQPAKSCEVFELTEPSASVLFALVCHVA